MDIFEPILRTLETVSIIVASGAAIWGLNAWRREMIGRRKAEMAEQTLAAFYEVRDIIRGARHPGGYGYEGRSRPPIEGETESEAEFRNSLYVPVERLLKRSDFFASLDASEYRFRALFGNNAAKPFDEIRRVRDRILISSKMLVRTYSELREESGQKPPSWEQWEQDIGRSLSEHDPLSDEVDAAVARIEKVCRSALKGR